MKEEKIEKLKASLESLVEDYLGKDINNYQKLGVRLVNNFVSHNKISC